MSQRTKNILLARLNRYEAGSSSTLGGFVSDLPGCRSSAGVLACEAHGTEAVDPMAFAGERYS
jgi:hypothetical protein